jgi:hypothetical protein
MRQTEDSDAIRVGEGSKCTTCVFGRIIMSRAIADPVGVAMERRENPQVQAPPNIVISESLCTHREIVGSTVVMFQGPSGEQQSVNGHGPAKSMGVVLSCELFEARKL